MFFPVLAVTIVSAGLLKLGALSVWVTVLTLVIQGLLIALSIGVGFYLWQRYQKS